VPRRPIPEDKRQAILADIRAGKARNTIAREHRVGAGTVTKIAQDAGLQFDRSAVKRATEARIADQRAQRATTSQRFLDETNRLLDEVHEPHMVFNIGGRDNVYTEHLLDEPPTADKRNLIVAAATAFDKHLKADLHDSETGAAGARSVLGQLAGGLQMAAEIIDGTPD
jgi:hypothetical protein